MFIGFWCIMINIKAPNDVGLIETLDVFKSEKKKKKETPYID